MLREMNDRIMSVKENKKLGYTVGRNEVRTGGCEKESLRNFGKEIFSYWHLKLQSTEN